jgi:uncharacterized protein (TIGR00369 family)
VAHVPSETETAARVRAVLDIPLNRFLDVRLRDPADPAAGLWFPVGRSAQNQAAVLHGGVVTTLLDTASYLALLRPVAADARVDVTATVLRRGRAVAFMRAEAVVDGELVATAQVTKSVVRLR